MSRHTSAAISTRAQWRRISGLWRIDVRICLSSRKPCYSALSTESRHYRSADDALREESLRRWVTMGKCSFATLHLPERLSYFFCSIFNCCCHDCYCSRPVSLVAELVGSHCTPLPLHFSPLQYHYRSSPHQRQLARCSRTWRQGRPTDPFKPGPMDPHAGTGRRS